MRRGRSPAAVLRPHEHRGEAERRRLFESWPVRAWARGVDVQQALDSYAMVVSLEAYDIAVRERGWTPDAVEAWWHRILAGLLLRQPAAPVQRSASRP